MKKIYLLPLILVLLAMFGKAQPSTQNPFFTFPPYSVYMPTLNTPSPIPNYTITGLYVGGGASLYKSHYSHNMISDAFGNPMAYLMDGNIFDKNGDAIEWLSWTKMDTALLDGGQWKPRSWGIFRGISGFSEVCVVPNPQNCHQYFFFLSGAVINQIGETGDICSSSHDDFGSPTGEGGIYRFFDGYFYPFYGMIDFSLNNANGTPGKIMLWPTRNAQCGSSTMVTEYFNVAPMFPMLYESSFSLKNFASHYAATDVIGTGASAYNLLFYSDGENCFCLKLDGTSPLTLLSKDSLINADLTAQFRGEMEVVKLSNGNYRVAWPYVNSASNSMSIHVQDYTSAGALVPGTAGDIALSATGVNPKAYIHGMEFTPDGSKLYFTHETTSDYPGYIYYVNIGSWTTLNTVGTPPSITDLQFSQIELNYQGTTPYLYLADSTNIVSLNPSGNSWNTSAATFPSSTPYYKGELAANGFGFISSSTPVFPTYLLPDQIDGADYSAPFKQPACCYAYGAFDVKQGSPYTAPLGTATWSPGVGNNPWNSVSGVIRVNDKITIPNGAVVTIKNMTFSFTPTASMRVLSAPSSSGPGNGGRLVLNNSILTVEASCETGKMWPGVQVDGFNFSSLTSQGTFANSVMGWMYMTNGSKIEHALTGVRLGNVTGSFGGGVLQTVHSTFENNQIDVDIKPCPFISTNKTYFYRTTFQTTAQLKDPAKNPIVHVRSTDAIGIHFFGSTLQNTYAPYNWFYDGIQSNNSTIRLMTAIVPCTFKNLRNGIWAQATPLSRTIYCTNAQFIYNVTGAYLNVVDYATFLNNTFKVLDNNSAGNSNSGPLPYGVGLYLNNCTGFKVQGNTFQNNSVTPAVNSSYNYTFGCIVNNSALRYSGSGNVNADNFIFKNTFKNINWGCQAQNTNYDIPNCQYPNTAGLKYYCNTFISPIKDVEIGVSSGGIDYNQGYVTGTTTGFAADNSFSKNNPNIFPYDFYHVNTPTPPKPTGCSGSYSQYFSLNYLWSNFNTSVVNPKPALVDPPVGVQQIQTDANTCGANPYNLVINNPYADLPSEITQLKSEAAQVYNKYDCGNTAGLLSLIASNGNPGQLKNQLSACAPFLSDKVLISYVNNPYYPAGDKQVILSACSPLSDDVMLAVQNSAVPRGIKEAVANQQTGVSPATMLANQVSMLNSEIKWCYDEIIRSYLNDTITPDALDSARIWIRRSLTGAYDGRIIRLELDQQDTAAAITAFQSLVTTEGTGSSNVKVHDALIKLHRKNVRETLQNDQVMYNKLHQVYADVNTPDARLLAQSLLSYVDEMQPTPTYELMVQNGNRIAGEGATEAELAQKQPELIACYPNPFSGTTTINAVVKEGASDAVLIIYDVMGSEVAKYKLAVGNNTVNFNAGDRAQEILFCSLVIDGATIKTSKLVLIK